MSNLDNFQAFVRKNGKEIIGVDVPVVLSEEENKQADLRFTFGWKINIGVNSHDHGGHRPSGSYCGSRSEARNQAHSYAKQYSSGQDPLFNNRMKKCLCEDVKQNFLKGNQNLNSAPDSYVGKDRCHGCGGSGSNSCYSCHGSGKSSCSSCSGSGRRSVQKYDSYRDRTVYTTESCNSCWGSGNQSCSPCGGSGSITCSTCSGGGYLYFSYTIDGDAKRSTDYAYQNNDRHDWTSAFIKSQGLSIAYSLNSIKEVSVDGGYGGCTFYYGMEAVLPTLQFKADVKGGSTHLKFAGVSNLTHDAGGIYDPAVWSIGQKLASGDKESDIEVLAVPAIKSIVESSETNTSIDLIKENWVSTEISNAIVANYKELVIQLKKSGNKGIFGKMFTDIFKNAYLLFMFASFLALLLPEFANDVQNRITTESYFYVLADFFNGYFLGFRYHFLFSYAFIIVWFWIANKLVKKYYWKRHGGFKYFIITLILWLVLPFVLLNVYAFLMSVTRYEIFPTHLIYGGSLLVSVYFLFWAFNRTKKWYLKPLSAIGAIALIGVTQVIIIVASGKSNPEKPTAGEPKYYDFVSEMLSDSFSYVFMNRFEIIIFTLLLTYFYTRRRFWLNSKSNVTEYNSPVLLKSMKMD